MINLVKIKDVQISYFAICVVLFIAVTNVQSQCLDNDIITLNNISKLNKIQELTIQTNNIFDIVWSVDEKLLFIGGSDETNTYNRIWTFLVSNLEKPPELLESPMAIQHIWSSRNSPLIIATQLSEVNLVPSHNVNAIQIVSPNIDAVSLSGDLGVEININNITVWDLQSDKAIFEKQIDYILDCEILCYIEDASIDFSESRIVYSESTYTLPSGIININNEEIVEDPQIALYDLAFSSDDELIISTIGEPGYIGRRGFVITNSETGEQLAIVRSTTNGSANAVFSPDGQLAVFTGTESNSPAERLIIWSIDYLLNEGESDIQSAIFSERASSTGIDRIAFHPSGKMIAISSPEKGRDDVHKISIWGGIKSESCESEVNQ